MLAQRMQLFGSSGTASARAAAKAAIDAGRQIIDLTAGEIWSELSPTIAKGAVEAIRQGANRYTDTIGLPDLRAAVASKLARETKQLWEMEEIAITAGAKQALFNVAMVLLDPGDEVIVPVPYWTTFPAQILLAGAKPVFIDTRHTDYSPTISDISAAISDRTKAIVINTPNNPTGTVYGKALLEDIARLAIERDLWVIFDECYSTFLHASHVHHRLVSLVPDVRNRTLIINAFSKSLALTGWRIGYLAGPSKIISAVRALQSHTTSNPNVIAQYAVLAHLTGDDIGFEAALRSKLAIAREAGLGILAQLGSVPVPAAQGGFYFYLDLSTLSHAVRHDSSSIADDLTSSLLKDAAVAVVSGSAFGDPAGIRISYGASSQALLTGLPRLVDHLNAFAPQSLPA